MTHAHAAGADRTVCGIRLNTPDALPYCGLPRFVRTLPVDVPHCPDCCGQLDVLAVTPPDPPEVEVDQLTLFT